LEFIENDTLERDTKSDLTSSVTGAVAIISNDSDFDEYSDNESFIYMMW
jgi:hypothetical protein